MSGGYQPPRCECGHTSGDHQSSGSRTNPARGICYIATCGCKEFREVKKP